MEEPNTNNTYPLSEEMISLVEDFNRQANMLQGALTLFCRIHKLSGAWNIAPNGREIVRPQQQYQPHSAPANSQSDSQ